jgi:hypothetical protein
VTLANCLRFRLQRGSSEGAGLTAAGREQFPGVCPCEFFVGYRVARSPPRRSSASWNPGCNFARRTLKSDASHSFTNWIPACAGMTGWRGREGASPVSADDELLHRLSPRELFVRYRAARSPHRRSSASWNPGCNFARRALKSDASHTFTNWIPACAGMTGWRRRESASPVAADDELLHSFFPCELFVRYRAARSPHRRSSASWNPGCSFARRVLKSDASHTFTNWIPACAGMTG